MVSLIESELTVRNWLNPQSSFLLDGFPRTEGQAKELDATLDKSDAKLNLVVELDVPEKVILDRIENRWVVSISIISPQINQNSTLNTNISSSFKL